MDGCTYVTRQPLNVRQYLPIYVLLAAMYSIQQKYIPFCSFIFGTKHLVDFPLSNNNSIAKTRINEKIFLYQIKSMLRFQLIEYELGGENKVLR